VLHDREQGISRAWGARMLPASVILDRRHRIVARGLGAIDWDAPAVDKQLQHAASTEFRRPSWIVATFIKTAAASATLAAAAARRATLRLRRRGRLQAQSRQRLACVRSHQPHRSLRRQWRAAPLAATAGRRGCRLDQADGQPVAGQRRAVQEVRDPHYGARMLAATWDAGEPAPVLEW
jgi:hypothetical protein